MEIQEFIFVRRLISANKLRFLASFLLLFNFSCSLGNCRSHKLEKEQIEGPMPVKENKLIPPTSLSERVKVFKLDGSLQCSRGKKIDISEMQNELKDIKVYSSFSENDGMMRIQMCGAPTGNGNVFEIDRSNLKKALSLGFKEWLKN